MKKLIFVLLLLAVVLIAQGQVTPGKTVRIADRTTAFGANLSVGTTIYCVSDSTYWVVKSGTVAAKTITSAIAGVGTIMQLGKTGPTLYTENFEIASDGIGENVELAFVATDSTGFRISLNGVELNHAGVTGQCWVAPLANKKVYFRIPVYQYDLVTISYTK
jgi:hypothetical protein